MLLTPALMLLVLVLTVDALCFALQDHSDLEQSQWVNREGEAAAQGNLAGCTRRRSFVIPKSAMVAATRAECRDEVLADGEKERKKWEVEVQ